MVAATVHLETRSSRPSTSGERQSLGSHRTSEAIIPHPKRLPLRPGVDQQVAANAHALEPLGVSRAALEKRKGALLQDDEQIGVAAGSCVPACQRAEESDLEHIEVRSHERLCALAESAQDPFAIEAKHPDRVTSEALLDRTQESPPRRRSLSQLQLK